MSERIPNLIVVSGPSGAGKSTVLKRVLAEVRGLRFSVSHTTRPPRPGEADGREYHFVPREEFEQLVQQDRFLEWAEVHRNLYGTCVSEYEQALRDGVDLLLDLDVKGAEQVRRRFADAVSVFIAPPSYLDLERRLRGRGPEAEANLARRLRNARAEISHYASYDFVVINEELEQSIESLEAVVRAVRCRTSRQDVRVRRVLSTFPKEEE